MKKQLGWLMVLLLAAILPLVTGCEFRTADVGPLETKEESVELGGAERVEARITMGAGLLEITGGASALMDGTFIYNVAKWEPEVTYSIQNGAGRLMVEQPDTRDSFPAELGNIRYEWEVSLNENVPLDLHVDMGAGEGKLELDNLRIDNFSFEGGAGEVNIDLSGSTASDLEIRMGAGKVTLDLSGDWRQNLSADIRGGIGTATVLLPREVGVRVETSGGLGQVRADDLNREGSVYTNDAYGDTEVTLDLRVEGGIGEIVLRFAG